ncbi:hypothetical protein [Terrihabitans rhizophilus]|uniref:Uncharacterized protein n=1 Tax=Terrihabitans rhizophilus TaxID=3092662 RepID=A0ABU4RMK0_9HYPH|nr:hypothetical protein [Terrihabitans sp. PJ23]MDX6805811.1 hypothetical protein [Terrihabitans sp. PJ23]
MPPDDIAERPRRLIHALGHEYGFERSVKLAPGAVRADRYVVSVHAGAFGDDPEPGLMQVLRALDLPGELEPRIQDAMRGCDVVHLGYEGTAAGPVFKVYLEHAAEARAAMALPVPGHGVLVHLVLKWNAVSGAYNISRYVWPGDLDAAGVQRIIGSALSGAPGDPGAVAFKAFDLLRGRTADYFLLDVHDETSPRRSFDLMLYGAGLLVSDLEQDLLALAGRWNVGAGLQSALQSALRSAAGEALGHLSAGLSADGTPFATFYYGAKGFTPKK